MKKLFYTLILLVSIIALNSCNKYDKSSNDFIKERYKIDDIYIDITIYDSSNNILNESKNIIYKYYQIFDENNEYSNIENVYSLNKNRNAIFEQDIVNELKNIVKFTLENPKVNVLTKNIRDIWNLSCVENKLPDDSLLQDEVIKTNNSNILIDGNKVSIEGDANVTFDCFKKGFILKKVAQYLKDNGVKKYAISYDSSLFIFGENINNENYEVFPSNVSNGYVKVKNKAVSVLSSDGFRVLLEDGRKYTNIYNSVTGYSSPDYTRMLVFSDDIITADLLSYYSYVSTVEEIKQAEEKYKYTTIAYNWINLSYINTKIEVIEE